MLSHYVFPDFTKVKMSMVSTGRWSVAGNIK